MAKRIRGVPENVDGGVFSDEGGVVDDVAVVIEDAHEAFAKICADIDLAVTDSGDAVELLVDEIKHRAIQSAEDGYEVFTGWVRDLEWATAKRANEASKLLTDLQAKARALLP